MDRLVLAERLSEMATYFDLLGENPFKVRAYQNAARVIETFDGDFAKSVEENTLREIKGIGPAIQEKILEFYKTDKIKEHDELRKKIPDGLLEMLKVPSLGAKKVRAIHDKLGICSLGELEYACRENRLLNLTGFGEVSQAKILKNIEYLKKFQQNFLFSEAILEANLLVAQLKTIKTVKDISVAGSLRRKKEIVRDIDILVATDNAAPVTQKFLGMPNVESVTGTGDTKTSVILKSGIACDLRVVRSDEYAFALLYFTGSKEHNTAMRQIAKDAGYKLNEYGLFKNEKTKTPCKSEEEIYRKLGLDYVPPEMREGNGELEAAASGKLPQVIEKSEIRGVFHCHTNASDGTSSLEEMVATARNLGLEYIGISDHSGSAFYANGLKKDRVLEQFKKIEALQKKFSDIKIFKGAESDILADGKLDYDDELLRKFDFVIGSVHSNLNMSEEKMTARVLKAMKSPYLDFVGHPTGRLLLARDGFALNVHKMIDEAAKQGVVIEMNSHPQRLDIDWRFGKYLREKKVRVSLNPDAHSAAAIEDFEYGVGIARKAWLSRENVLNALPASKVLGALRRARLS